jgi:hypothetical protein
MRFKVTHALIGVIGYVYLFGVLVGIDLWLVPAVGAYAAGCMAIARGMLAGAQARRSSNALEFSGSGATDALGEPYGSFHHVYQSSEAVNEAFRSALSSALKGRLGCSDFRYVAFKDVDANLEQPETRNFFLATAPETLRGNGFTLLCSFTRTSNVQSVRWWVLVAGLRDPNKVFWRYALAPFTVPFVIVPYLLRQHDPIKGLMTIHPGFFNGIDVLNRTREIQFIAFETLVEVLDAHGVDTTDLKQQRNNILNVNVSGQASFGSVVQGAMNRVSGVAGGAQA